MADLRVNLCGKTLQSPVIAASGTFGFGVEYENIVDLKKLGAVSGKGLTLEGKYGNEGERLWETPSGLINSIGLQLSLIHISPKNWWGWCTSWAGC